MFESVFVLVQRCRVLGIGTLERRRGSEFRCKEYVRYPFSDGVEDRRIGKGYGGRRSGRRQSRRDAMV